MKMNYLIFFKELNFHLKLLVVVRHEVVKKNGLVFSLSWHDCGPIMYELGAIVYDLDAIMVVIVDSHSDSGIVLF